MAPLASIQAWVAPPINWYKLDVTTHQAAVRDRYGSYGFPIEGSSLHEMLFSLRTSMIVWHPLSAGFLGADGCLLHSNIIAPTS